MDNSISPSTLLGEKAYVGRIKDAKSANNLHNKKDFIHAIIYENTDENFDFLDLKKLVDDDHEGLVFYTNLVDRSKKKPPTWNRCMEVLKNKPPVGQDCVAVHDHPLSFGKFAELAYSQGILTNSDAFNTLKSRIAPPKEPPATLPPPTSSSSKRSKTGMSHTDAVKSGIDSAISMKRKLGLTAPPNMSSGAFQLINSTLGDSNVASNVVLGDEDHVHGELSREYWQGRALKAEEELKGLKEKLSVQNDELIEMRTDLCKSNSIKEGFAANADLAQMAVRETQALAAKPIIDGLLPQLSVIPKIVKIVESLNGKLNALENLPAMVKELGDLPTMVKALENLPAMVTALKTSFEASDEKSVEEDDARASESESMLCYQKRVLRILENFGFSHGCKELNVPGILTSIMSAVRHSPSSPDFSSSSAGQSILDTSKPPPRTLMTSGNDKNNYLLNQRNNNPAPGGLMPTPQYHGDFHPNHGHYGQPPHPSPYGPGPTHGYGPSTGYGPQQAPGYGAGHGSRYGADHAQGHGQGPPQGYGPPNQGAGHNGKRPYPFVDTQGNERK